MSATSGVSANEVSQTTLPVSLSVAMMRGGPPAAVMTKFPHKVAPRFRSCRSCFGSMRHTMRPASPERAVDLVEHAPGIGDVEEAVLGERRRLQELVAGAAAERHRIGELEVLDVVLVDARERREALPVIGAVVHQPVLRLRIGEPLRRHIGSGRERRSGEQHADCGESGFSCHRCLPFYFRYSSHLSPRAGQSACASAQQVRGSSKSPDSMKRPLTLPLIRSRISPASAHL